MELKEVKEKIQKLLNLAGNHAATDSEVESALKIAQSLMLRYQLDEASLNTHPEDKYKKEFVLLNTYSLKKSCCTWEYALAQFCCEFNFSDYFFVGY